MLTTPDIRLIREVMQEVVQKETLPLKMEIDFIKKTMATKDDIKDMAKKTDIKDMVTKQDIKDMATKEDIKDMVTKEDIKDMVIKEDIKDMATKADLAEIRKTMATKEDIQRLSDQMVEFTESMLAPTADILHDHEARITKLEETTALN